MICYKVVNENGDSLFMQGKYVLHYGIGEKVKPKIGKIFVFKTLATARRWAVRFDGKVLKCETDNITKIVAVPDLCHDETDKIVEKFWERGSFIYYSKYRGFYVCDALTVIKEV